MEALPGLHQISGTLGLLHFFQYLLAGKRTLLVDTGIKTTPEKTIFPYMEKTRLKRSDIDFVVVTHADVDHFGGNHAVKKAAPKSVLCVHYLDAP